MVHTITGEIDDDDTDVVSLRRCTECGREAAIYVPCRPPRIEDLAAPQFWRECVIYGTPEFPAWYFCPFQRFFMVTGSFRVQVERPGEVG